MKEPLNVSSPRGNLIACHGGLNLAAITPDRERDPTSRRLCYSNRNSFRSRQAIILEKSLHNPSCVTVLANAARWRLEAGRPAP